MTPARPDRYLSRVDDRLTTFTTDRARRLFIVAEIAKWQERYENFRKGRVSFVEPGAVPPSATDYLVTIAGLDARLAQYRAKVAA